MANRRKSNRLSPTEKMAANCLNQIRRLTPAARDLVVDTLFKYLAYFDYPDFHFPYASVEEADRDHRISDFAHCFQKKVLVKPQNGAGTVVAVLNEVQGSIIKRRQTEVDELRLRRGKQKPKRRKLEAYALWFVLNNDTPDRVKLSPAQIARKLNSTGPANLTPLNDETIRSGIRQVKKILKAGPDDRSYEELNKLIARYERELANERTK